MESYLDSIAEQLLALGRRAYSPYSKLEQACIFLYADSSWIPGVRVENASYPLTITAFQNAWASSLGAKKSKPIAIAFNKHLVLTERHVLQSIFPYLDEVSPRLFVENGFSELPDLDAKPFPLVYSKNENHSESALMKICNDHASHAVIEESRFPVSSLVLSRDSNFTVATNVEAPYWPLILCAERNALSTAISYGLEDFSELFLSCPNDLNASPCGACRQVICELALDAEIVMYRGDEDYERTRPVQLLPGPFLGENLRK